MFEVHNRRDRARYNFCYTYLYSRSEHVALRMVCQCEYGIRLCNIYAGSTLTRIVSLVWPIIRVGCVGGGIYSLLSQRILRFVCL